MSVGLPGWSPEIEKRFKEVLFRFLEEIQCTKAALYLVGPDGSFMLATQYGFGRRDLIAAEHRVRDPLTIKVRGLDGVPKGFNRASELGPIADYLKSGRSSKLLLVPLVNDDELVGFVDARDKGRKRSFETPDLSLAKDLAETLLDLGRRCGLVEYREVNPEELDEFVSGPAVMRSSQSVKEVVPRPPMLDDPGLEEIHDAALFGALDHNVVSVVLTLNTREGAATLAYVRRGAPDIDHDALLRHQAKAMSEAGLTPPPHENWKVEIRRAPADADPSLATMIASAVLLSDSVVGSLTASVIGGGGAAVVRRALERLRARVQDAHEKSLLRFTRRSLSRRLLQPGEHAYPDLVAHSEAVSQLAWSIALALDFGSARAEEAALAGLLHDVGMRELDYERLYRKTTPTTDDRRLYQEHPITGEHIVRGTGLDGVAAAIRHHHERWDGNGYPDRLVGEHIPVLARLVHVAEVYDVLSSTGRYRPTLTPEKALGVLTRSAGHQFDPKMVEALTKVIGF